MQAKEPSRAPRAAEMEGASLARSGRLDPVWQEICEDARAMITREPIMAGPAQAAVLGHPSLEEALSYRLAQKLGNQEMPPLTLLDAFQSVFMRNEAVSLAIRADLAAVRSRDPACDSYLKPLMYFKGFLALQAHRAAHEHWKAGSRALAAFIQMRVSEGFDVDAHPAARIGKGIMIDHATGVVIGETTIIEDDVSIMHGVTLGGTGKETGDRHPKIGTGVLLAAGACVLGNIRVGKCSKVAAGSVVLRDVPPCKTVAGVPAIVVGDAGCDHPASAMDHAVG